MSPSSRTLHSPPRLVAPGGPVTRALRALREAEALPPDGIDVPDADAPWTIGALRDGLIRQAEADLARAERCLACLDLLDGDPDAEDGGDDEPSADDEPSLGSINPNFGTLSWEGVGRIVRFDGLDQRGWSAGSSDDGEMGDDNGIADECGEAEQFGVSRLNAGGAV